MSAAISLRLAAPLLFAAGAAALIVETTWMRWFALLFGATAPAAAAALVAFFAGHAAGAALAARWIPRTRRPLAAYGALQIGAGLGALAVVPLLQVGEAATVALYADLLEFPGALTSWRLALALLATLPAALCVGAAFPAIGAAALAGPRQLGSAGSALYGFDLLGAAGGTALAAFWLPAWIGVNGSYGVGVALLAAVGGTALALQRPVRALPSAAPPRPAQAARSDTPLLLLATFSGFGALATQVLLVRAFDQILNGSVVAFGAVLVTVFTALALGAAFVALLERTRRVDPRSLLGASLAAAALGLAAFPAALHAASDGLAGVAGGGGWAAYAAAALRTVVVSSGLPLLAVAVAFPALFAAAGRRAAEPPADGGAGAPLGRLLAANTLGAIAGALVAPFVLLPAAGLWGAFLTLALAYGLAALWVPPARLRARLWLGAGLAAGGITIALAAPPLSSPLARVARGEVVLFQETSAAGVVSVVERGGERRIRTDNHYVLGGTEERVHEERQGHLPLLVHPTARRVAFLGTATGITAGAATLHPVSEIHLVEIVPGVIDAARGYFGQANRGVYDDPRARIVRDDARNFLRTTRSRFDAIVADLFVPWRARTASLYAREHFEAARRRLEPDGLFWQWLPLYQLEEAEFRIIAATFLDVFPRAGVFRGDFYGRYPIAALAGWAGEPAPARAVSDAAERLAAAGATDRWVTDRDGIWSLYVGPLAHAPGLARAPRNTDARPRIEFLAARSYAGGTSGALDAFVGPRWALFADRLRSSSAGGLDPLYPGLSAAARRVSEGGALLQRAGAYWAAGRAEEAASALALASERLPRSLVADAPADPTAAELWWDAP
ncbi:MAG: hypothetical protein V3U03_09995 [Myxococcota bacterium]